MPSLIREVCQRKGFCEILDLGSGVPDCYGSGSYGSFKHTAAAREAGLQVRLTAVDVIFPPMSRFLPGESPHSPDYDFPGVAAALKDQGVECVGEDYDVFIRKSAEQALLSLYAGAPPAAGTRPVKWDIILQRAVYGSGMPEPTATASDWRVLLHDKGYILRDFPAYTGLLFFKGGRLGSESAKSESLKSKIYFAQQLCRQFVCFRAILSLDSRYVVIQATQHEDMLIEPVVLQSG